MIKDLILKKCFADFLEAWQLKEKVIYLKQQNLKCLQIM